MADSVRARVRAVAGVLGSMTVSRAAREAKLDSIKISRAAREVKLDSNYKEFRELPARKI